MPDPPLLPSPPETPLLDKPREDKLLDEIRDLRQQLEQERKQREGSKKKPIDRRKLRLFLIIGAIVIVLAFLGGFIPHYFHERELKKDAAAKQQLLPVITYIRVKRSPGTTELELPGTVEAITEAPILARADGYLGKRYADIGDRVRQGQLLAEIDAPDLDQQVRQGQSQLEQLQAALKQAQANLEQGRANQLLAKVTAERYAGLLIRGAVSRQENDQQQTSYQANSANVGALEQAISAAKQNIAAGEANLGRLRDLQGFEKVRAPFTGFITLRNVDTGALISTGNTLLYRIAQIDRLRTYIYVPEPNAPSVQAGQPASLYVMEYPGREFQGSITRTSNSMDPTTRTLLTEVQVSNPDGVLLPGTFALVNLNSTRPNPPVLIPGDALLVESNGTYVGVLQNEQSAQKPPAKKNSSDQKSGKQQGKSKESPKKELQQDEEQQAELPTFTVHLVRVNIGRDYGNDIEVVSGLNGGELVISNPNDSVREGAKVKGQLSNQPVGGDTQATGGANANENTEKMAPVPGGEPNSKQPSKENTNRGPGF